MGVSNLNTLNRGRQTEAIKQADNARKKMQLHLQQSRRSQTLGCGYVYAMKYSRAIITQDDGGREVEDVCNMINTL